MSRRLRRRGAPLAWAGALAFATIGTAAGAHPLDGWLSLCTAAGAQLLPPGSFPAAPGAPKGDGHGLCAHAACQRDWQLDRKARRGR